MSTAPLPERLELGPEWVRFGFFPAVEPTCRVAHATGHWICGPTSPTPDKTAVWKATDGHIS